MTQRRGKQTVALPAKASRSPVPAGVTFLVSDSNGRTSGFHHGGTSGFRWQGRDFLFPWGRAGLLVFQGEGAHLPTVSATCMPGFMLICVKSSEPTPGESLKLLLFNKELLLIPY